MQWWKLAGFLETSQDPRRSEQYLLNIKVSQTAILCSVIEYHFRWALEKEM